jgi:hypothetical protein
MRAGDGRPVRPPLERFDLFGEEHRPPLADLFAGLSVGSPDCSGAASR